MRTSLMISLPILLLLLTAVFTGCGSNFAPANPTRNGGSLQLRLHWPDAAGREMPASARSIRITVTMRNMTFPAITKVVATPVTLVTIIGLPDGIADVDIVAYDTDVPPVDLNAPAVAKTHLTVTIGGKSIATPTVYLLPTTATAYPLTFTQRVNNVAHVFLLSQNGMTLTDLTPDATVPCETPTIARNGQLVVYVKNHHLWSVDPATGQSTQLTVSASTWESAPAISPDGSRCAFLFATPIVTMGQNGATAEATLYGIGVLDLNTMASLSSFEMSFLRKPTAVAWANDDHLLYVITDGTQDTLYRNTFPATFTPETLATAPAYTLTSPSWNTNSNSAAYLQSGMLHAGGSYPALSNVQSAVWLPDGSRLALCYTPDGQTSRRVYLLHAGEAPIPITDDTVLANDIATCDLVAN